MFCTTYGHIFVYKRRTRIIYLYWSGVHYFINYCLHCWIGIGRLYIGLIPLLVFWHNWFLGHVSLFKKQIPKTLQKKTIRKRTTAIYGKTSKSPILRKKAIYRILSQNVNNIVKINILQCVWHTNK